MKSEPCGNGFPAGAPGAILVGDEVTITLDVQIEKG
jgi:hypothetical protein